MFNLIYSLLEISILQYLSQRLGIKSRIAQSVQYLEGLVYKKPPSFWETWPGYATIVLVVILLGLGGYYVYQRVKRGPIFCRTVDRPFWEGIRIHFRRQLGSNWVSKDDYKTE